MKPLLTVPEAAEAYQMDVRKFRRLLKGFVHLDAGLMVKGEGQRTWKIQREALQKVMPLKDSDFNVTARHGKRLDDHEKRISALEATYDLLAPA